MALFNRNRENKDYVPEAAKKTGIMLGLSTIRRELISLITLNFMFDLFLLPAGGIFLAWALLDDPYTFIIIAAVLVLLTLLTMPAAITAMNRITTTMVRDENFFLWPDFWKAWKNNFGKSLAGGMIFSVALGLFLLAAYVYYQIFGSNSLFMVIIGAFSACLFIITLMAGFYFWPMLSYVDLPLKALLKNSLILVLGCWKRSLLGLLTLAVTLLTVGFWPSDHYDFLVIFFLMLGFSLFSLCMNFSLYPAIYDKVIRKEEEAASAAAVSHVEDLKWDDAEELRSASVKDLDFGPDEN